MQVGERTALPRTFFARPATEVAPDLLGKALLRADEGLAARVVEVEAYTEEDPACHAHRGQTRRNAPLFGPPGHAYVYFVYGMHWCLNVATGVEGRGEGCLLRAAEPLEGRELMRARRFGERRRRSDRELLRGPARLAQAYGLDGSWSGADLCGPGDPPHGLCLADDGERPAVTATPRTGVATAAGLPWRFVVPECPWVSAYKRHPRT